MSGGQSLKKQNITTYTIGFNLTQPLLEKTAKNGGGKYYYVWELSELQRSLSELYH